MKKKTKKPNLNELIKNTILAALEKNDGHRTNTAKELGIPLRTLTYKLKIYKEEGEEIIPPQREC